VWVCCDWGNDEERGGDEVVVVVGWLVGWWLVAARLGGGSEMGNQEGRRRSRWSGCKLYTGDRRQAGVGE